MSLSLSTNDNSRNIVGDNRLLSRQWVEVFETQSIQVGWQVDPQPEPSRLVLTPTWHDQVGLKENTKNFIN
jgi:hypothetical protein